MTKVIALAFILFAFSSIVKAQNAQPKCEITLYGPEPEPECETIIDENGQEQESCFAVGSAESRLLLNKGTSRYQESSDLSELHFAGTCECTLQIYTRVNLRGLYYSYPFSKSADGIILVPQIWSHPHNSFRVLCKF